MLTRTRRTTALLAGLLTRVIFFIKHSHLKSAIKTFRAPHEPFLATDVFMFNLRLGVLTHSRAPISW